MSFVYAWFLISAALASGVGVLVVWNRRRQRAVSDFADQLRRLTLEPGTIGEPGTARRIGLEAKSRSLKELAAGVNTLLEKLEQRGAYLQAREQLFEHLIETVPHAVLVHRKHILFANSRCLALLGMKAADVIGRPFSDFVTPEYAELVGNNLRRRLGGEPAADRYEVDLLGDRREAVRVELSSTLIDSSGEQALLLTALEMLPEVSAADADAAALPAPRLRAVATLNAMGESVITVDATGRIDYVNPAAAMLLGQRFDQVVGKTFPDVAALVDESDRRSLGDPISQIISYLKLNPKLGNHP